MKAKIADIAKRFREEIAKCSDFDSLQTIKVKFFGKSGELTGQLKCMKELPPEERTAFGSLVNSVKQELEQLYAQTAERLKISALEARLESEKEDITIEKKLSCRGTIHPINKVTDEIVDMFVGLGFKTVEGPEIETDYYNFQALNLPADHPARDMQDTFYVAPGLLLRSQTSPNQVRVMEKEKAPIKILCPGKVYRSDSDASHSPIFHQIEGLVVDKNLSLCDLKGCLEFMARRLFDDDTRIRFRPSYFPFTEPSVEVDVTCSNCHGKGCPLCKYTGWIEILGAGMVHPNVLENCGVDSKKFNGFAFGVGIERIAIIKYGIPDIRLFYENDVRFLKQFK